MKLRSKMIVSILAVILIAFIPMVWLISTSTTNMISDLVYTDAENMSDAYARRVGSVFETAMQSASDASTAMLAIKEAGNADRNFIDRLTYALLRDNEEYFAVWCCFEPDRFDGKDALHKNDPKSDGTGRVIPWYFRKNGGIEYLPLTEYANPGVDGEYYRLPRDAAKPMVVEPYMDEAGFVATVAYPIIENGVCIGVIGIDINLESLSEQFASIKPYETGYARLISAGGLYVTHQDEKMILGQAEAGENILEAIGSGESISETNNNIYTLYSPVELANTGSYWSLAVAIPLDKALSGVGHLRTLVIGIAIGIFALLSIVIFFVSGSIVNPIKKLSADAQRLARGETNFEVNVTGKDETAMLARSFRSVKDAVGGLINDVSNQASAVVDGRLDSRCDPDKYEGDFKTIVSGMNDILDSVNNLVYEIRSSADRVSASSSQLSAVSNTLAQGSTEQAIAFEQLSASMDSITTQVGENTENARRADDLAHMIRESADGGSKQMEELINAINEIHRSAENISKIIKTIEEISFNTNILAINASVEAARAGQHGSGFAVVANEVRELATRSAHAANETAEIVSAAVDRATQGVELGERTRASLGEIVDGIRRTSDLIGNIAQASYEQNNSINNINNSLGQASMVIQSNSATAEESAASSQEMSEQAEGLKRLVSHYVLDDGSQKLPEGSKQFRLNK